MLLLPKRTFSALEIQKQIGHKFYEPIWDMMHKIRRAMGERDATYKLQDEVEVDDGFFEVVKTKEEKAEEAKLLVAPKKKRGKGSDKQQAVLVMVESRETGNQNKYQPNKAVSHNKMVTLDGLTASDIDFVSKKAIDSNAVITSDNATYYSNFSTNFKQHNKVNISKSESGVAFKRLPWVHKVIANAKRNFLGLHHSVGRGYLQNYLNEFAWKFNRRYTNCLFDRILVTAVTVSF